MMDEEDKRNKNEKGIEASEDYFKCQEFVDHQE